MKVRVASVGSMPIVGLLWLRRRIYNKAKTKTIITVNLVVHWREKAMYGGNCVG